MDESILKVRNAVDDLQLEEIREIVHECLAKQVPPLDIINNGVCAGLEIVGKKFEEGEYFLAELILAGEVVNEAMPLLEAELVPQQVGDREKVILATAEGDIHEIGKSIVGMLLRANGYEVVDLGVDVPAKRILEAAKASGSRLVGVSALLTTAFGSLKELIDTVDAAGLKGEVRVVIGGACTSERLRAELGADAYGESALQAVKIFDELSGRGAE